MESPEHPPPFTPLFDPALSEQRRTFILNTLRKYGSYVDWILDMGCASGSLSCLLVNSCLLSHISHVDIDQCNLEYAQHLLQPKWMDTYFLRERPLKLDFYVGNLCDFDSRMKGVHAVVFSEVIEHLDPDLLPIVPCVLFEYYQPKIVIISTPNADFNPNFPTYYPGYLRDDDHKFEWTQTEFESWCVEAAKPYGYDVVFDGVGVWTESGFLPKNKDAYATQFAIFTHPDLMTRATKWPVDDTVFNTTSPSDQHPWTLTTSIRYPWHEKSVTLDPLFEELRSATLENRRMTLAEFWNNRTVKHCFRTLEQCKEFLKNESKINWTDPGHEEYLVDIEALDGGEIRWMSS